MKAPKSAIVTIYVEKSETGNKWVVSTEYGIFSKSEAWTVCDTVSEGVDRCMESAVRWVRRHDRLLDRI
jgi:hypothetical protein